MLETPLAAGPTVPLGDGRTLQFLGMQRQVDGAELYDVSLRPSVDHAAPQVRLAFQGGTSWTVLNELGAASETLELGSSDDVFALAMGQTLLSSQTVAQAVPHWPSDLKITLARRQTSGPCAVAFDARWFLTRLTDSAIDQPLLFPNGAERLGLRGVTITREVLAKASRTANTETGLIALLQQGLDADAVTGSPSAWTGDGRLIGESTWGDLSQVGTDIADGCIAAVGTGPFRVTFDPDEPMGIGFAPEIPSADAVNNTPAAHDDSVGTGVEVGMVDSGEAAEAAGVRVGMVATQLSSPDLVLHTSGVALPFEEILQAIDTRRDADEWLTMTFNTASPNSHWYAVEMPAAPTLRSLGVPGKHAAAGPAFDAVCGPGLLWREPIPRLFLGESGSLTCAHVDICPQVQVAYGLLGTKILGVASHAATPQLAATYSGEDNADEPATVVPTDRPMSARQARLLASPDISLVLLRPGDIAVIHSGALHFASNGADSLGGSLYHGIMTTGALPRLRVDAAESSETNDDEAFANHLFAADLLTLVEERLSQRA